MKTKKKELDVDFIGGQTSLTKEEERAISEFIKKNKSKRAKSLTLKAKTAKQLI
jgi:hypothetical protein